MKRNYNDVVDRADRVSAMIVKRAREVAREAGIDPQIPFLHAHNAMCGFKWGKPWKGVNYSLVRKVLWLEQRSFEPRRIVDRWYKRVGHENIDWS